MIKNRIKAIIKSLSILLILGLLNIATAITLEDLQSYLAKDETIRANFIQERAIAGMKQPLRSSGKLIVSQKYGLYWAQENPFNLSIILTEEMMVQQLNQGKKERITAKQNPQLFQFNHLLSSLFHLDQKMIEQNFSLQFTDLGGERWEINLTPKRAPINKIFKSIQLSGKRFVEAVTLEDQQGDQTKLSFSQHNNAPLDVSEADKFEP